MANGKEPLLTIDGVQFRINLIKLSRSASILDKTAHRTINGDLYREVIGTYVNYSLQFAYSDDPERYDLLWNKLIEPKDFHTIILPNNIGYTTEFLGYISNVKDEIIFADPINGYRRKFNGLSCDIVAKTPTSRPN